MCCAKPSGFRLFAGRRSSEVSAPQPRGAYAMSTDVADAGQPPLVGQEKITDVKVDGLAPVGGIPPVGGNAAVGKRASDKTDNKVDSKMTAGESPSACFECNICLDIAQDPIVTQCGHLYCWPCIYKWLQVYPEVQQCPVCKAGVSMDLVIPLYGRGCSGTDPRRKCVVSTENVPCRPQGLRLPAQGHLEVGGLPAPAGMPVTGFGLMPSLLGYGFQFGVGVGTNLHGEPLSPEQQQQAFLSRLLLMLGSFVIMCLLIF